MTSPRALPGEPFPYDQRLTNFRGVLKQTGLSAILIAGRENIAYLSGFRGSSAILLITSRKQLLFTDFRYRLQAAEQAPLFQLQEVERSLLSGVSKYLLRSKASRVGFESDHWRVQQFSRLKKAAPNIQWRATEGRVEQLRERKDPAELGEIARAAKLTDRVLAHMLSQLAPGKTEREIALAGELFALSAGAKAAAFDFIVASGPRSALPHAEAGGRKLRKGDLIVFDLGIKMPSGYCSDLTRTVALGKAAAWQKEIYGVVYAAQTAALAKLRSGLAGRAADATAREIIAAAGYGEYFGHALGHGVGLEVHEAPRLSAGENRSLASGMVVTVEPGIYLPDRGGVRIEDLVVVTEGGCRRFSHAPKPKELPVI